MKAMRPRYPLPQLCRGLKVSPGGYYAWLTRKLSKQAQEEGRLEVEMKAAHKRTRETCGPERPQHDLEEHGVEVGVRRIRRVRKKLGTRCEQVRKVVLLGSARTLLIERKAAIFPGVTIPGLIIKGIMDDEQLFHRMGRKASGRLLDGKIWEDFRSWARVEFKS